MASEEDNKTQVSGEQSPDAGLPQPTISGKAPASPTSALTSEQILEALKPLIKSEVERGIQSTKDKRFSKLDEVKDLLAQIKAGGGTVPPALEQQVQMEDTIERALTARGVTPVPGKSIPDAGANQPDDFSAIEVVKKYGLDTNNPDVVAALKGRYNTVPEYELAIANIALKVAKPAKPSETLSPAPAGGSPTNVTLTEAQKSEKYGRLDVLYKSPSTNKAEIQALEKELGM